MGSCFTKTYEIPITSDSETTQRPPSHGHQPAPPQELPTISRGSLSRNPAGGVVGPVLLKPMVDVKSLFHLEGKLGSGATYLCTERATGLKYVCRSVPKRRLVRRADVEDVRREVAVLQHLSGQPNVVELKAAFEDAENVHLIVEFCPGGALFDRVTNKGSLSERQAAAACREILAVVHACHFMGVMHRDLTLENLLLATNAEDAPIKATGFGHAVFIEEGEVYTDIVGSSYHVAPEVLHRNYGKEIDVWNAGFILYILLCGSPPFWGETDKAIFDATLVGQVDLSSAPWPLISESAKDLVRQMLNRDPQKRITAAQALEHPWIKGAGAAYRPTDSAVLSRLKQFSAMNKLKQLALKVIAENLSPEEIKGLRQLFSSMDTDRSGTITVEELKVGLSKLGSRISEADTRKLLEAVDVAKSGSIYYTEFLTAMMDKHKLEKEENLLRAFQHFDKDNNGYITRDELEQAIAEYGVSGEANIKEVLDEVDKDKDQRIDYEEFVEMMRRKTYLRKLSDLFMR